MLSDSYLHQIIYGSLNSATFIEELEMFIERATLYTARPKTEPENNSQIL